MRLEQLIDKAKDPIWKGNAGYKIVTSHLNKICDILDNPNIVKINTDTIDILICALEEKSISGSTINRYLSSLHTLLKYAVNRDLIEKMPVFSWKREREHRIRWVKEDEEKHLIKALTTLGNKEAVAAVQILLDTGLRRGELLSLTEDNIDGDWVRIWKSKTGRQRSVPLTPRAKELLSKTVPFKIHPWDLWNYFRRARDMMGLTHDKQFVLHTLRHTTATRLLKKTQNIAMVQKLLGHSKIETTLRYAHIDDQDLMEAVNS